MKTQNIGLFGGLFVLTVSTMACSGGDTCYVKSPDEWAAIPSECTQVFVTGWPTDNLELTSSVPGRSVFIGPLEGIEGSVPFELRRIQTEGIGAVHGTATEEADLRDVTLASVAAPHRTIAPRVFEEPCEVWATNEPSDAFTGLGLGIVPGGSLHVTSLVELKCLNIGLTSTRETIASSADPWANYALTIDETAKPVGIASVTASASLSLEHLKEIGTRLKHVQLTAINDQLYNDYVAWLDESAFGGVVERCIVDASGQTMSCSTVDVGE